MLGSYTKLLENGVKRVYKRPKKSSSVEAVLSRKGRRMGGVAGFRRGGERASVRKSSGRSVGDVTE